ncbi:arylsulfotransferase family protein [Saccharicrinis sp. FJH62]|uniref:arylsulfotransferase family protein n=1 Tax=Saccharicrinis sp. FJH62 TaxID=3344657 RepID=UPI0035D42298
MKKILQIVPLTIIGLFILSIFGWISVHISNGDKEFRLIGKTVKYMYTFPDLFATSVNEFRGLPETFIKTPENFQSINKLDSNIIALTSYTDTDNSRIVALINLKNDSILYSWSLHDRMSDHVRIFHPLLLPEKNLVYYQNYESLKRIDSLSNVIWKIDSLWPHHAINIDDQGDIWISTHKSDGVGLFSINERYVFFKDEYINKIDVETGSILFQKSFTDILTQNNLSNYLLKSGNVEDPIHINDIEPALKTTPYYQRGDVFISARSMSAIFHYRPATNKIIKVIEGPFVGQHDVDFYNDNSLVFFNNNKHPASNWEKNPAQIDSSQFVFAGDHYSQLVRYNFNNESFSFIGDQVFKANKIYTLSEGLVDFFENNTYFVEEQNSGILWIIKDNDVIYKNVMKSGHEGFHNLPNWTRIINNYE